ncbi:uncharacterized protein [Ptychodera flava]|uniref:uncharacterized protein n=1 Tax=Ptychodera flava TaxID=63121 RepID=UPI003969EFD2
MAAAPERKVLEEIGEDFLCCTICLDQFKSPKILPCLHTFCEQCLVTLVEKTGSLNCPECRQQYQLPVGGVAAIKGNFFMSNLIEIFKQRLQSIQGTEIKCEGCQQNTATHRCVDCRYFLCNTCSKTHRNLPFTRTHQLMTIGEYETAKSTSPVSIQAVEYCNVHTKNEVKFYCETCQVPVCTDCTIVKHRIPEHVHRDLKDAADEYLIELKTMFDKLKVKEQKAEKIKTLAKQIHTDLTEQCSREERKVRMKAEEIIKKIKREEQRLIDELKNNYKMKIKRAAVDIDEMELKHGNIKSACSYIETLMHHGNAVQLLSTKDDVGTRIKQLINMETKVDTVHEDLTFTPNNEFCEHGILGILKSDVCMSKCTVENIPKQLLKGDSADLLITTRDSTGKKVIPKQPVKAKVRKPDASWEDINVADNRDGTHRVTVGVQLDGKYQFTMTIGDQPIPGCPVIIPVIKGLVKTIGSQGSAEGQYNNPWSVAINKDRDIVTTDTGNYRLQINTKMGKFKKCLKFKQFKKPFTPRDIAISNDNTYYSLDYNNKQVVVNDENGHVIRYFGQNELKSPRGIWISPVDGKVYVTDEGGDCVRVYTQHGKYRKSFGSEGMVGKGKFSGAFGVVIATTGMVFVADYINKCIQVFDADDKYLYSFDCQSGDGKMRCPTGIAIENHKYVYVTTDTPSSVLKFESSGEFVCRIDSDRDGLNSPTGIALTDDVPCNVVVADTANHCIKVFTYQLMTIEEYETAKSTSPVTLQAVEYCNVHTKNEVKFYCETCQVPVCTDCTIVKHRIPEHVHRNLKDAADEYLIELKTMFDKLKVKEQKAEKIKTLAKQIHTDLTEQCSREERKVRMKAEEIIKKIKREEHRLKEKLKNNYKMKIKRAAADIDEMELKHGNIKSACSYIDTLMHHGNYVQLLSTKGDVGTHIKQLITMETKVKPEHEHFTFTPNNEFCEHGILGILKSDVCMSKCTVENIPKQLLKEIGSDNTHHSLDNNNKQVVVSDENGHVIRYFGQNELKDPYGIGISPVDGNVYVTDRGGHCVRVYTQHGKYLRLFGSEGKGQGQFNWPWGVVISSTGMVFVADHNNQRIQVFNADDHICLEQFKSPKILPCLHTFCQQCLVSLVEKTGSLNCPECRQQYQLPVGGVPAIKGNFFMSNLMEIFKQRLESMQGKQCSREERKVRMKAEEIIKKIKREEQRLIDELKHTYAMTTKRAAVDIDEMELKHGNILSACSYIETLMHHGNAVQLLSTKGDIGTRIKQLITMDTKPKTYHDFIFRPHDKFSEHGILGILESQYDIEISKCTIENVPKQLWKGDFADLLITTRDSTGNHVIPKQQVKAKVRKPDASWEDINVDDNRDGTHRVTVAGELDGQYQVTMTTGDQPIPGCPVIIPVIKGLVKTIGSKGSAEGQWQCLCTDWVGDCVKVYTQHGQYLRSFGSRGEGQGQFSSPLGVVIATTGVVFVADYHNQRIQVFNAHDQYLYSFDCQSGNGEIRRPKGIKIENDQFVYVTTTSSYSTPSSVLKFESSGKFVCRIDSDWDRLNHPLV